MSFLQVISSNEPFVPGVFYTLRELLEERVPQIQDETPELVERLGDDEVPELIDIPNDEDVPELIEGSDGEDDESGEEPEYSLEDEDQDFLGEHLERLRTQIFQLSGHDECFNLLCPCGRCDKYRGQPLVYQKPTFKTQVSVEDFTQYSDFEMTQRFF
ncbi:hypothetical protein LAU_0410 [Lausannevirus]|uniref:Uncharacterized protein n=2 Tax=Lausannevirus TaxID=999883 RepID=A0A0N9PI10_9VIRU|nr:hypothetical protein LAU_0410 [Lausannevirus]AEA07260.1 hypothetical protein LAU_0410 [Lausannevirus]ALH07067.1 hypothetical protein PMV_369 [Port-miou virus]